MRFVPLLSICSILIFSCQVSGDVISLSFFGTNGDFDFEQSTGSYTTVASDGVSGVLLSFEALVGGSASTDDILNADGNSLGVNADGGDDIASQLDATSETTRESIRITFSSVNPQILDLALTSISVTNFSGDSGTIAIGGNSSTVAAGSGSPIPNHGNLLGQSLTVSYTGGFDNSSSADGFGIAGITLNATVPEPGAAGFFCLTGVGFLLSRRKS